MAVVQLVLACGLVRRGGSVAVGGLAAACIAVVAWCPQAFVPHENRDPQALERVEAHAGTMLDVFHAYSNPTENALVAKTAPAVREAGPRGTRPLFELEGERVARPAPDHTSHAVHYVLDPGPETTAEIRQIYLPGWRVELDSVALPRAELERGLTRFGTIGFPVPSETRDVRAWYDGPLLGRAVAWGALLTGLVILAAWCWIVTRSWSAPRSPDGGGRA